MFNNSYSYQMIKHKNIYPILFYITSISTYPHLYTHLHIYLHIPPVMKDIHFHPQSHFKINQNSFPFLSLCVSLFPSVSISVSLSLSISIYVPLSLSPSLSLNFCIEIEIKRDRERETDGERDGDSKV